MFASSPVAQPISSDCPHPSTSRNGGASFARAANVHAWSNPLAGPELLDRVETAERPREEEGVKLRWTLSSKKTRGGGGVLRSETLMQWAMNGESGLKVMISPFKTSSRISRRPQKPDAAALLLSCWWIQGSRPQDLTRLVSGRTFVSFQWDWGPGCHVRVPYRWWFGGTTGGIGTEGSHFF